MGRLEKKLLEEIYYRYGQEIFRYLFVLCRDRMLAEDVLQETFCRAVLSLPSGHTNVRAWLYLVGRNLMFNEMKKRRRETPVEDMSEASYMEQGRSTPEGIRRRRKGANLGSDTELEPVSPLLKGEIWIPSSRRWTGRGLIFFRRR